MRQTKLNKVGRIFKNIALASAQVAAMVQLQACDGSVQVNTDSIFTPLKARIDQNIEEVKTLQSNGFLDSQTAETIIGQLNNKKASVEGAESSVTQTLSDLADAQSASEAKKLLKDLEGDNTLSEILSSFDAVWIPAAQSYDEQTGQVLALDTSSIRSTTIKLMTLL